MPPFRYTKDMGEYHEAGNRSSRRSYLTVHLPLQLVEHVGSRLGPSHH